MLTKSLDNIAGTAGNDTIIGSIGTGELLTYSNLDMINGGAGVDTLKIADDDGSGITLGNVSNVEVIEVQGAKNVEIDTSTGTGVTNLNITKAVTDGGVKDAVKATAAATTDINVSMKAAGDTVAVIGGKAVTVALTDVAGAADVVSVGVGAAADPAGAVNVTMTGKAYTAVTAATTLSAVNVTGGTTINVTQKAAADTAAAATDTTNTGNEITQGAVNVLGNASTTAVTVKQDAAAAAKNATNKTGGITESTSVKFGVLKTGDSLAVAGLTFTAKADMTAVEVASAFANLINGTNNGGRFASTGDTQGSGLVSKGTYTGIANGWTSGAASGDTVVFTSTTLNTNLTGGAELVAPVLTNTSGNSVAPTPTKTDGKPHDAGASGGVMGVLAGKVDINDVSATIKTITVDGYANASATTNTTVLETLNLSNSGFTFDATTGLVTAGTGASFAAANAAATMALNLEKVGVNSTAVVAGGNGDAAVTITAGAATLNVKSTGNNYVDLSANATTTLNVSGTGVLKADTVALGALKTVKVTETAGLSLDKNATAIESVDTTGTTGTVTTTIDGQKATYTGGAGVDNVTLSTTAPTKAISTGAGNDKVTLASGTTVMGTGGSIAAGDGTADTLVMVAANAETASGGTAFASKVTGFERVELTGATGAQTVKVADLGNYNDVAITGEIVNYALTLNGLTSGATVRLNDSTQVLGNAIAAITNADKSTTDVLNIAITDTARDSNADANGTVTAAEVETVNISLTDGVIETPINLAADQQQLTLVATKATKIVVTGDAALSLTNVGNIKVAEIDASAFTGALTVAAAGTTATTIKGGSGADVLTASASGAGSVAQVSTIKLTDGTTTGLSLGDKMAVTVGATTFSYTAAGTVDMDTAAGAGAGLTKLINDDAAYDATYDTATDTITVTAAVAATQFTLTNYAVTDRALTKNATATPATITELEQVSVAVAAAVTGTFDIGDKISLTFDADGAGVGVAATVEYSVLAGKTALDDAAAELVTVINAAGKGVTAAYDAGTDTFTITDAISVDAGGISVNAFTVTDLVETVNATGTAATFATFATTTAVAEATGDVLQGGKGNDTLIANSGLATLTGGEGNDLFVIGVASLNSSSYATITDFVAGDLIELSGATTFAASKVTQGDTAVFQDYANAAINAIGANAAAWFQFQNNTYIVMDAGADTATFTNGQDFVVKLTGLVDLTNATFNTIESTIGLA